MINVDEVNYVKHIRNILIVACVVITVSLASSIVMPIIFSAFLAIMISPLVRKLEGFGIPKVIVVLSLVIGCTAIVLAIIVALSYQSQEIISSLADDKMEEVMKNPTQAIEKSLGNRIANLHTILESSMEKAKEFFASSIPAALKKISNALAFFVACPIYMFFMLFYRQNLRGFYYESLPSDKRKNGNEILNEIEESLGGYIKGMLWVVTIISLLTWLGLWALGLEYALFLGVLAGILSLLPFIGIIISALIPIILALATKDSLWYPVGVIGVFVIVQFLEGNVITPKLVGNKVNINPMVVILGIVIFGSIGGIAAMVLTIPILALLRIVAKYKPEWKPIEKLLKS